MRCLVEHVLPGRWDEARQPSRKEIATTLVLALPLDHLSTKMRTGAAEQQRRGPKSAGVERRDTSEPCVWHAGAPMRWLRTQRCPRASWIRWHEARAAERRLRLCVRRAQRGDGLVDRGIEVVGAERLRTAPCLRSWWTRCDARAIPMARCRCSSSAIRPAAPAARCSRCRACRRRRRPRRAPGSGRSRRAARSASGCNRRCRTRGGRRPGRRGLQGPARSASRGRAGSSDRSLAHGRGRRRVGGRFAGSVGQGQGDGHQHTLLDADQGHDHEGARRPGRTRCGRSGGSSRSSPTRKSLVATNSKVAPSVAWGRWARGPVSQNDDTSTTTAAMDVGELGAGARMRP